MKLKRQMIITPAYDKRSDDPNKNYGIGSCRIFFVVIGSKGAITVNFGTNWYLPSTIKEYKEIGIHRNILPTFEEIKNAGYEVKKEPFKTKIDLIATTENIRACSWNYHSKKPMYKEQASNDDCEFTGGKCYCDGSSLKADNYLSLLFEKGSDGVFEQLEADYKMEFDRKSITP